MRTAEPPLLVAADWLLDFLRAGPRLARELHDEAAACGLSRRTLARAKFILGVKSFKAGYHDRWYWVHPDHLYWFRPNRREVEEFAPRFRTCYTTHPNTANPQPKSTLRPESRRKIPDVCQNDGTHAILGLRAARSLWRSARRRRTAFGEMSFNRVSFRVWAFSPDQRTKWQDRRISSVASAPRATSSSSPARSALTRSRF